MRALRVFEEIGRGERAVTVKLFEPQKIAISEPDLNTQRIPAISVSPPKAIDFCHEMVSSLLW